jgi:NitT/TauT family transport system permease protein
MTKNKSVKSFATKYGLKIFAICFWLLFWELISRKASIAGYSFLLPSPSAVVITLFQLSATFDFWQTIWFSFARIVVGFFLALAVGTTLAIGASLSQVMKELISPVLKVIKATPVASFIILALMYISSKNLSVVISFLMVLPMVYANVYQGIKSTDIKLLEMAKVFHLSNRKKIKAIYIPAVMPHFVSAVSVGIGFSWKAGVAAEVIGYPSGSIGERLYEAKLYYMFPELFAWTVVIIIISILFEKAVLMLLGLVHQDSLQKNNSHLEG